MILFPAIDLYDKKAVRLFKGDYSKMTVYSENPTDVAKNFINSNASHIHIVDLQGAKTGETPNFKTVCEIKNKSGVFCETGGGIRTMSVIDRYIDAGLDRVILGTAAVANERFVEEAVSKYGDKIAVGVDIKDGLVAVKGWMEKSSQSALGFCEKMQNKGVKTLICTDISKDGALQGTNLLLYKMLSEKFQMQIIASGGVSSMEDLKYLSQLQLYGAIIGKAYYTGDINLKKAIEVIE